MKNREILFKGKRVDNGEWVFGTSHNVVGNGSIRRSTINHPYYEYTQKDFNRYYILERRLPSDVGWGISDTFIYYLVHPDTVCQFTGLLDKKGNKIFEGDKHILTIKGVGKGDGVIEFENGGFVINAHGQSKNMPLTSFNPDYHELEITGNIHD